MNRLHHLPDHPEAVEPTAFAGPDHPMRKITRAIAIGGEWTPERARKVADLFDGLAGEWSASRATPERSASLVDALDRGEPPLEGHWLELGSGTGLGTAIVAPRVRSLVCADLAAEMLRHAPEVAPKVRTDASALPFPDDAFDALLLVNMLLFPTEVDRVLRANGAAIWVNTQGDQTPIHLPAGDVLDALPGEWTGVSARAGSGFWLVAKRATTT